MSPIFKASTFILLTPDGKVLLTLRKKSLKFLGGFHVYPGGRVDDEDYNSILSGRVSLELLKNLSSLAFMSEREMIAHIVAGIREVFEETGIFLGSDRGNLNVVERYRKGLLTFDDVVKECDISVPENIMYLDHWLTPPVFPVRFDTRFFLVKLEGEPEVFPNPREIEEYIWIRPEDAITRAERNQIKLMPPTYVTLKKVKKILAEKSDTRIT